MKIFVIVLSAFIVYASSLEVYVGPLQDWAGGPIVSIGCYQDPAIPNESPSCPYPSCTRGPEIGNRLCGAMCLQRGHMAGPCVGNTCVCRD